MKNIPRHKLDKYILPGVIKHRKKKSKNRRWKAKAEYIGPAFSWFHSNEVLGYYETEEEAEKAIEKAKKNKDWVHYKFEIVKSKRSS